MDQQFNQSPQRMRRLGWVLVACGGFLSAFMGYLIILITRIMRHSDDLGATSRFTGDGSDAAMIFAILGLVLVFGVAIVFAGVEQIRTGRRNPKVVGLALLIVGILYVGAMIMQFME